MKYPKYPNINELANLLQDYASLKTEVGSKGVGLVLDQVEEMMKVYIKKMSQLDECDTIDLNEPNELNKIQMVRPEGVRRFEFKNIDYKDKLTGALIGRMAGCTLGAPVEFWSVTEMESWARYNDEEFPPVDYWKKTKSPYELRYLKGDYRAYTREGICKVPVDDDIAYTLLTLLILEEYGSDFTTENVAMAWKKYLPMAYTAEKVTLENLKSGMPIEKAGIHNNPYYQWIGADIRSDGFGYICPGYPEKAAEMAYRDSILSHRRNGVYGAMFFAACCAAAFYVDFPLDAIQIGLQEIPKESMLAQDVRWALKQCDSDMDYKRARKLVDSRFEGMSHAHTSANACLTIFGLYIGGKDLTKVISNTVAMGMDNDCTAATAGSIVGAIIGISNIDEHWYTGFNNTIDSYLMGEDEFTIDEVVDRFMVIGKALETR